MNKEQKKRMASREFVGTDSEQAEITYTIQVSGKHVELHRGWEEEWDNADGTGQDDGHDCWLMTVDDLKKFVECATWTIQKSEAFEAAHPNKKDDNHDATI